ncbi:MAG: tripartite tricarboxylate transporter TctB family protein [Escherichia coli]
MPLIFQQLPLKRIPVSFPTFGACALIVLVLLVIRDLLQANQPLARNAQEKPAFRKTATGIAGNRVLYCGDELLRLSHYLVFPIVIMTLMGYRRWVLTPGIALLLTAILWLLFVEALQVPLPVLAYIFRITGASNV